LAVPGAWPVAFVEINGRRQASAEVDGELQRFNISEVIRTQEAHEVRIELQISADLSNAPCFVGLEITG
jgi:hypothetical protein